MKLSSQALANSATTLRVRGASILSISQRETEVLGRVNHCPLSHGRKRQVNKHLDYPVPRTTLSPCSAAVKSVLQQISKTPYHGSHWLALHRGGARFLWVNRPEMGSGSWAEDSSVRTARGKVPVHHQSAGLSPTGAGQGGCRLPSHSGSRFNAEGGCYCQMR